MRFDRPGHRYGAYELAKELAALQRGWRGPPEAGMYRAAVEQGVAPGWIASNLDTIELIERKAANHDDPLENLKLAFSFPAKIRP